MPQESFIDDMPKVNPWQDDLLGYRLFAERLTHALSGIDCRDGFVVGLHGRWGSGKSSILNFVTAFIDKFQQEDIAEFKDISIIRFDPWIVSGHQDLVSAFFKILSESLADESYKKEKRRNKTAIFLKRGLDPAIDAAATLGATIDHTGGIASRAAGSATKRTMNDVVNRWLEEPSLQSTYMKLQSRMRKSGRRFVVMIDDIDRLQKADIRLVMEMVKSVGRLPNIIYVLSYDRDIVWAALDEFNNRKEFSSQYGEKIVQHELEIPKPSKSSLLKMLDERLSFLPPAPIGSTRWMEIVHCGIRRWINNPRDVVRLVNALQFSWSALKGEIDAQDLICMEGLRLFQREIYIWIKDNRDLILGEGRALLTRDDHQKTIGENLRSMLSDAQREETLSLLCAIFPTKIKLIRGDEKSFGAESWYKIVNRRGIATKAGYDSYFSLSVIPTEIPKSLVDLLMDNFDDQDFIYSVYIDTINKFDDFGNTLIGDLFEQIQYRIIDEEITPSQSLLNASINIFDHVNNIDWNGGSFSPYIQLYFLNQQIFKKLGPSSSTAGLKIALMQCPSLSAKAAMIVARCRECGLLPADGADQQVLVEPEPLRKLAVNLAKEIAAAARRQELSELDSFVDIIKIWSTFGSSSAVKRWLSKMAGSSPQNLVKVSKDLLGYSRTPTGRAYNMFQRPDESYHDLDVLKAAVSKFRGIASLTTDEASRIEALDRGLTRYASPEIVDA